METLEIQIFVSCPGDVNSEKKIVEDICKNLLEASQNRCKVRFIVREWKSIIAPFGERPQQIINEDIKDYDIYLGIFWMRFGTKTGAVNPNTGQEYESGTQEEFVLAHENYKAKKIPQIHLFIRESIGPKDATAAEQLWLVKKFVEEQQSNGWINSYSNESDFKDKIYNILVKKLLDFCSANDQKIKQTFIQENPTYISDKFKFFAPSLPVEYIARRIVSTKNKEYEPVPNKALKEVVLLNRRIVLLGDAGSGKSTELLNVFHTFNSEASELVPIFQNFNVYTPDLGLEQFLPQDWKQIPQEILLIIWDGLDEIQPQHYNTVARQLTNFSLKYPDIRLLVSCRTNFYEIPSSNFVGTLADFIPYYIDGFNFVEMGSYFEKKTRGNSSKSFIKAIFKNNLSELVSKPFFLQLVSDFFLKEGKLSANRQEMFDNFLKMRFEHDIKHFNNTVNIKTKQKQIMSLLERVAVSMEILNRNYISESELIDVVEESEFELLKYCTAFKRKEEEDEIWQFEHNNIQEFLAAKALSQLEFEQVIKLITFQPGNGKLIPTWVNTITFLFSILDGKGRLYQQLLAWLLNHEREIIVKFEKDRIPTQIRTQIFVDIFEYYKERDIWISSNKFTTKDLAKFGESAKNIEYIINELRDLKTTRIVRINSLKLIGHFQIKGSKYATKVKKALFYCIDNFIEDKDIIHDAIYALKWGGFTDARTIAVLMGKFGARRNQYIRSAIYSLLKDSDSLENYINYLIEGCEILNRKNVQDRDGITLFDEDWNLQECFELIKAPKPIKIFIDYISEEDNHFETMYKASEVINKVLQNAVVAYHKDNSLFESVFNWFVKDIKRFRLEKLDTPHSFFSQTGTIEQAFHKLWASDSDKHTDYLALAKLLTPNLLEFVINQYNNHEITNDDLKRLYFDVTWVNKELVQTFEIQISQKTSFVIPVPSTIDHDAIQKLKTQKEFDVLFKAADFKKETLQIFKDRKKATLSIEELYEIRRGKQLVETDEHYSGVSLRLLREFTKTSNIVVKSRIVEWFKKEGASEWYRISLIYDYLANYNSLKISESQKKYINQWCSNNLTKINFKQGLTVKENRISINTTCIYIAYFSRRFDFKLPENILLDMLSFDYFIKNDWAGIENIVSTLSNAKVKKRMLDNVKRGIPHSQVLINHIKYLAVNRVVSSYPYIHKEILNGSKDSYERSKILEVYFDLSNNLSGLKLMLPKADYEIELKIIEKLMSVDQSSFLIKYLKRKLDSETELQKRGKYIQFLVSLQDLEGLNMFVDWLQKLQNKDLDFYQAGCISSFRKIEALPSLIELIKISYKKGITVDGDDRFYSIVVDTITKIGTISEKNLMETKRQLLLFIKKNIVKMENLKFLHITIERMEEQFYANKSKVSDIAEVKRKLKLIYP
jgi:hypothetical protein